MSSGSVQDTPGRPRAGEGKIVNDFSILAATRNGSGSQTSNIVIMRALFDLGIPVSGKNLFPSNIKGLPTWFTVRVSAQGWLGRREPAEICAAMNPATADEDMARVPAGGVILYPDDWDIPRREDVTYYAMPVKGLLSGLDVAATLKPYIANMIYVGYLAAVLGIDLKAVRNAIQSQFPGKQGPIDLNFGMVEQAAAHFREHDRKRDRFHIEPMDATTGKILIEGNAAAGLGSVFAGYTFIAWYPITPSTSVVDAAREYSDRFRRGADGKPDFAIVQAEDELAALGMVIGAGWAGARAMTATSGPGISLMAEFAGLAYFTEVPAVVWDIQRMGPSTGMPTRTSQGDLLLTYYLSHGDTRQVVLLPGSMKEIFEFASVAFDLAERLQTIVFVLSDLEFGMNLWMSEPFDYPDRPADRGKVLTASDLERLGGEWGRFRDPDGDGIGWRTLPGTDHPKAAYFTRGSGHNQDARYTERPDEWEANLARLHRKFETARTLVPRPVVEDRPSPVGLIHFGSTHDPVVEARHLLRQQGIETGSLRLRALPTEETTRAFLERYERVYVVENNYDGQLAVILRSEYPEYATRLRTLAHCDGLALTADWIVRTVLEREGA